jgi:hypothetical protein
MNRNTAIKLTEVDKKAAKTATLGVHGMAQADGTL